MDWIAVGRYALVGLMAMSALLAAVITIRDRRKNWWPSASDLRDPMGW